MSLRTSFRRVLSYTWTSPNTLLGLVAGAPAFLRGHVTLVDGVLELSGPGIEWLLRRAIPLKGGASAITFGHVVVARDEDAMERCRVHERVHVRQYERWGPLFLPAYLGASVLALAQGKHVYLDNAFEVEARQAESAACEKKVPGTENVQDGDQQGRK